MDVLSNVGLMLKIHSTTLLLQSDRFQIVTIPYGPGIRVDTYLYPGCTVSGYYDSLVAKLIAWGGDFEEARKRTRNALDEFIIEGINTTIPLYKTIMGDQNFIKGDISTDYLERFGIMDKMNKNMKEQSKTKTYAAIPAVLLQSELVKKGNNTTIREGTLSKSKNWKTK